MSKSVISIVLCLLIFGLSVGCSSTRRLGQFTAASSHNVRNLNYSIEDGTKVLVKGSSCYSTVFGFSFGEFDDRIQRAMDAAIANGQKKGLDGDLLVNVRIAETKRNLIFFGKNCMVVQGNLVKVDK